LYKKIPEVTIFQEKYPETAQVFPSNWMQWLNEGIVYTYREMLYQFLQRFVYHAEMVFFGSIVNPVGCAVAYR
jgi:hypothetical protein